ncbi:MAG: hypothetical protein J5517_05275 [Eubacterium sp.]|nr:hypothetical protein [Eubacterium sp.]
MVSTISPDLNVMAGSKLFKLDTEKEIELYGHRGFSDSYIENTMAAYKGAVKNGFKGIEIDLWESENGDIMVFHDSRTKRLSKRNSYIWKVNKKNRKKYLLSSDKGKNQLIPTFEEVMKYASKNNITVLCHLKNHKKYNLSKKGVKKIIKTIKKYKMQKKAVIFASKTSEVKPFVGKGVRVGLCAGELDISKVDKKIKWLVKNGGDTLIITKTTSLKREDFGEALVNKCHKKGIMIGTYWTYNKAEFEYLKEINADFAMSDYNLLAE